MEKENCIICRPQISVLLLYIRKLHHISPLANLFVLGYQSVTWKNHVNEVSGYIASNQRFITTLQSDLIITKSWCLYCQLQTILQHILHEKLTVVSGFQQQIGKIEQTNHIVINYLVIEYSKNKFILLKTSSINLVNS